MSCRLMFSLIFAVATIFACSAMDEKSVSSLIEQYGIDYIVKPKSGQLFNGNCYRYSFAMKLKNESSVSAAHIQYPGREEYETCLMRDQTKCATDYTAEQYRIVERMYDKQLCIEQAKRALRVTEKAYMQRVYGSTSRQDIWQRWFLSIKKD